MGAGRTKAVTPKPPSLSMRRELSYLHFHQPFLFCLLDRRWILKTQGRRLFWSLFLFIPPMVGRGTRLFKSSCPTNNLTLHFWAFSFINLQNRKLTLASILLHIWELIAARGFTVFPEISSLKFNHICSARTVWKNKAFSNLMISVLRWKISCLP